MLRKCKNTYPPEMIAEARRIFKAAPGTSLKSAADKLGTTPQRLHVLVEDIREAAGAIQHRANTMAGDKVSRRCNLCKREVLLPRYIFNCGCNRQLHVGVII